MGNALLHARQQLMAGGIIRARQRLLNEALRPADATADWRAMPQLNVWSRVNFRSRTSDYLSRTSMAKGTPSFTFVDLGLNYNFNKTVKLGVGIYNLFDKKVDNEMYGAVYDGRRYWVSLNAAF